MAAKKTRKTVQKKTTMRWSTAPKKRAILKRHALQTAKKESIRPPQTPPSPELVPKQGAPQKPDISLFILAYNEEKNLPLAVELSSDFLKRRARDHEIIIIDDGSTDKTLHVAKLLKRRYPNVVIIHHHKNRGYGCTQKTGYHNARYTLVTYLPGDNQLRPDALEIMLDAMGRTNTDIIIGTRHKRQDSFKRLLLAGLYNFGLNLMFGLQLKDLDSVKIIRKDVINSIQLQSKSANVDVEFLVKAKCLGYKIREVPVPSYPRTAGSATGNDFLVIARQFYELWRFWLRVHLHI